MNLTQLQQELRMIEDHIVALHGEIENMKPREAEERKTDYDRITQLAKKNPVENLVIKEAPSEIKKMIMGNLSNFILSEEDDFTERLLFLTRLAVGSDLEPSAEKLYQIGLEFEFGNLEQFSQLDREYKDTFLVEALILANLTRKASDKMLNQIADLAAVMDYDKEELRVLGMVAKGVLLADLDFVLGMPVPKENIWRGRLRDFFTEDWLKEKRVLCGKICVKKVSYLYSYMDAVLGKSKEELQYIIQKTKILNQLEDGSIVKKDTIVCKYKESESILDSDREFVLGKPFSFMNKAAKIEESRPTMQEVTMTAPCNGVLNVIKYTYASEVKGKQDEYEAFYVVSYFDRE